jgi:hypothetical protein
MGQPNVGKEEGEIGQNKGENEGGSQKREAWNEDEGENDHGMFGRI